jgi:FimV-like protein
LDLTDPPASVGGHFPFDPGADHPAWRVRLELAQALWEAGQPHTARALVEDVAEQAHGALQQQAREWLAARA